MHRYAVVLVAFLLILTFTASPALGRDKRPGPEEANNRDVSKGVNFYSIEKEMVLGREMEKEVEFQSRLIDDPIITEFVNRLGQNLARHSDAKVPLTVKLLDSDEVNAFALPGGFLFVNAGLILRTTSESELAGVMAHEIAHVSARHWTKQATRNEIMNIASIPLIFISGWPGYAIREGLSFAMPLGLLQFSRMYEREADSLGLQYLYKAGYDPISFVDFFERIQSTQKSQPGTLARLFGTHPMTASRIRAAQRQIQKSLVPKSEYIVNTSEFDDIHARLIRIRNHQRVDFGRDSSLPRLVHRPGREVRNDTAGNIGPDKPPALKRTAP